MKRLALAVSVLLLAFVLVWLAAKDPGYVLIARSPWSFETSLVVFCILLVSGIAASYIGLRLLTRTLRIPTDVADWRKRRNSRQARTALTEGLYRLAACEWEQAEGQLLAGLRFSDAPMLNYLGAAIAAQGRGDLRKRDDYLAEAGRIHDSACRDGTVACRVWRRRLVHGKRERGGGGRDDRNATGLP